MAPTTLELARHHYAAGRVVEACKVLDQHLRARSDDPDGLMLAAEIHTTHGEPRNGKPLVTRALKACSADHLQLLRHSVSAWELGFHREADTAWRKAVSRCRQDLNIRFRYGLFLMTSGRNEAALDEIKAVLNKDPQPEVHTLYGMCLRRLGRYDEAIVSITTALREDPTRAEWWNSLGDIRLDQRRYDEAIRSYNNALRAVKQRGEARPDIVIYAMVRLADCFARSNMIEEAWTFSERAAAIDPKNIRHRFSDVALLPIIYENSAQVQRVRQRFSDRLETLVSDLELPDLSASSKAASAIKLPFYLHYQGGPDLPLQATYGQLVHRIVQAWQPELSEARPMPAVQDKIRVGFASYLLNQHTVTKLFKGWLHGLDRRRFEVYAYQLGPVNDEITRAIESACDGFVHLPGADAATACRAIREDDLHVLIFPELGMSTTSIQLGAMRSAPIQCMSWGHPVSSGLPSMDYMLSSDAMEPHDGQEQYTEALVRLPGLSITMSRAEAEPSKLSRADLGWEPDDVVYLVPQSLFKLLPDEDAIYPQIARRVPSARFIFIENRSDVVTGVFKRRLVRAFEDAGLDPDAHVSLLPSMGWNDYLRVNQLADVFLDGLTWSGGVTTMEAIAMGLVPVTCPGPIMRARHTAAILGELGVVDTVAEDRGQFVDLAVRAGVDSDWRADIQRRLATNIEHLYEDERVLPALESFIEQAVERVLCSERTALAV